MKKRWSIINWLALSAGLVCINFIASKVHSRFDLTEDRRYSVTPSTKALLRDMNGEVMVTVFLKGDFPSEFKKLSNSTTDFLYTLREHSGSKLSYRFISPEEEAEPGKSWADSLKSSGAAPINLNVQVKSGEENKIVYPYALVQYNNQAQFVNLFQSSKRTIAAAELNNAEAMLEYQFVKALEQMQDRQRPFIGYAVGNGEPTDARTYDLQQTIGSNYKLFIFNLKSEPVIPDTLKTLLIVKPSVGFTESDKIKLDQYVMRGGRLLMFIDNLYAEQDSLSFKEQLIAYDRNLNLQDLLFHYGARINPDLMMDLQCDFMPFAVGGTPQNPQYEFLHWNYYPLFETRGNHIINKNIGLVAARFVNSIDTVNVSGIKKTFLLQSSSNARTITTPALISPNENRNAPEDVKFKQSAIPAAVLLEGRFTSFYRARLGKVQRDSLQQYGGFREETRQDGKMIIVADGDVVLNDVSNRQGPLPMGMNLYTAGSQYEYQFANRDFLLNCLEYLNSNTRIIETRNKEMVLRLLDVKKVEAERTKWQFINIVLPVLFVIAAGVLFHYLRRRRFATA